MATNGAAGTAGRRPRRSAEGSRRPRLLALAMILALLLASWAVADVRTAQAATIEFRINFQVTFPGLGFGKVSFDGGAGDPLVGTNIFVSSVVGVGTPLNEGVELACQSCFLNFATGPFVATVFPETFLALSLFDDGGAITVTTGSVMTAGVPLLGIGPGETLLQGTFTSGTLVWDPSGDPLTDPLNFSTGMIEDTKHPALTAFYGVRDQPYEGRLSLWFTAAESLPNAFTSSTVVSGMVVNRVSEPDPFVLVALALTLAPALGAGLRRLRPTAA
jgi:hypothetical protein